MNIGRKIKAVRKRLRISRVRLGHLTDRSYSTISSYEIGDRKPPRDFLQMLEEIERAASHPAGAASVSERADLPSLRRRLLALEARVGAFENRFAALETRSAQLEARAEAASPPSADAPGVAVRRPIQVGDQDEAAPEKQPDEKTAEKKARQQEH